MQPYNSTVSVRGRNYIALVELEIVPSGRKMSPYEFFAHCPSIGKSCAYAWGYSESSALADLTKNLEDLFSFWERIGKSIPESDAFEIIA